MACVYDEELSHCTGCLRTLEEVWGWRKMSDEDKRLVLKRIKNKSSQVEEK
jgi:predicted Fe-S protein YdhL (DUF1289 family)